MPSVPGPLVFPLPLPKVHLVDDDGAGGRWQFFTNPFWPRVWRNWERRWEARTIIFRELIDCLHARRGGRSSGNRKNVISRHRRQTRQSRWTRKWFGGSLCFGRWLLIKKLCLLIRLEWCAEMQLRSEIRYLQWTSKLHSERKAFNFDVISIELTFLTFNVSWSCKHGTWFLFPYFKFDDLTIKLGNFSNLSAD